MSETCPVFDLLVEPWVPVVALDGTRREVGLLEALAQAHRLREVDDPSPLVTYGLHRLIAAVLQTVCPVADIDEWAAFWNRGHFPAEIVERVRQRCHDRLGLFHPTRPFYQAGDIPLAPAPPAGVKTVGYLFMEEATGTNVTHFSHRGDAVHAYCPACCAKGLVTLPPFAISGGRGLSPSLNGSPPIYVLPRGETLFATLWLNHLIAPFIPESARADPGLLWEQERPTGAGEVRVHAGFLEGLTWPPRRVRLYPGSGGVCSVCGRRAPTLVRQMVFTQGRRLAQDAPPWEDPWVAYTVRLRDGQPELEPVRPQADRVVWRDFPALFLARPNDANHRQPRILAQIAHLASEEVLPAGRPLQFETYSLRVDKAKVFEWRTDHFAFPPHLLEGPAAGTLEVALAHAERTAAALDKALRRLFPRREQERTAIRTFIVDWGRRYWQALEPAFRQALLDTALAGDAAARAAWLTRWDTIVWELGRRLLDHALDSFTTDFEGLRRQNEARAVFYSTLRRVFAPQGGAREDR